MLTSYSGAFAQATGALITKPVLESSLVTLSGNTHPEANSANDRGRVDDGLPLKHMLLQLQRSPQKEAEVENLIEQLHDPNSPNYHKWLTAAQFGQQYGLVSQDLTTLTDWLQSHGFTVNSAYTNGTLIDFSGTAGQVREAFHTEIHNLNVNGVNHIANMSDPQIPAALAPAIAGLVSLHNFMPHPLYQPKGNYTVPGNGYTNYLVTPQDLSVIYNFSPLFSAGTSGQGQTIVLIEDTDVTSSADFNTFRAAFGLNRFTGGTLTQVHPPSTGTNNCSDPGVNGNSNEASLDVEYASAAAPSAAIELASCSDTATTFGGLLAVQNLINGSTTPPAVMSISYGECEAVNGAASNVAYRSTFQQAVSEGVSVFVSSGDAGAAGCDQNQSYASHGIAVSGFTSTPYNVSVGGTDFGDTYAGTNTNYWNATNTKYFESAKSYVPEIPWNDSCASTLVANFEGYANTFGTAGFCNSAVGEQFLLTAAGSGGPSGCATGVPTTPGVVSGTCKGWAKPAFQAGLIGIPADGVRDIPDVSLFASNGIWGHYYPYCDSAAASCAGAPSTWSGAGGTSFAAPIMAGVQALVNQKNGGAQGNPNYVYYKLAAAEYGVSGTTACNSTLGNGVASTCTFYDVTQGDMDVNCKGKQGCYKPSGANGVLSTSTTAYAPAYKTTTGYDLATGIGSVNATNLVKNWSKVAPAK
jgi:subtilase family serine protease